MTDVPLLTHIEALFELHEKKRAALREADREWLEARFEAAESRFEATEKALKLEAAAWPTVENFNSLKTFTETEFAKLQGRGNMKEAIWRGLTVVAIVIGVVVAIFTFYAPAR